MTSFAELKRRNLRITGDTYHYRAAIKEAGGKWDNGAGVWLMPDRDSQRRVQGLVNGTFSEGFAMRPEREGPVDRPQQDRAEHNTAIREYKGRVADAKLSELYLRLEALSLALLNATAETALPLSHKIGEVLGDLARKSD